MSAIRLDVTIEQGATFTLSFIWKDSGGTPIDLTGYTARMQVRKSTKATTADLSLTTGAGITLGGSAGTIDVVATAEETAAMTIKAGVYDLELEAADGTVVRFAQGKVRVSPEVTR